MIVIGAGCSLIEGIELESQEQTWPCKLARRNGLGYINAGHSGVGNRYIARNVINNLGAVRDNNAFVIVQWSYMSRYDYILSFNTQERNSPWYTITPAHLNLKDETVAKCFGREYIDRIHEFGVLDWVEAHYKLISDANEVDETLSTMLLLQEFLKNRNIPYIFTTAENWNEFKEFQQPTYSRAYYDAVDWDNFVWFPHDYEPTGFVYWANANKFPLAPFGHPLEPAHEAAADLMEPYFKERL